MISWAPDPGGVFAWTSGAKPAGLESYHMTEKKKPGDMPSTPKKESPSKGAVVKKFSEDPRPTPVPPKTYTPPKINSVKESFDRR